MAFRIQLRRDTAENWSINNPVLFQGEAGYETDAGYLKIGNGITPWNDLPYFQGTAGPQGPTGPIGPTGSIGPTGATGLSFTPTYKVYTALLTQEGPNPPTAIVLENTLGGDVVWSYLYAGVYSGTLTDAFPELKTALFITDTTYNSASNVYILTDGSGNSVTIETYNAANNVLTNDILGYTTVEIRVYN